MLSRQVSKVARTAAQQSRGLTYKAQLNDIRFLWDEVLKMPEHLQKLSPEVAEEATPEFVNDVFNNTAALAQDTLFPLYQSGDAGCVWKDGDVFTPKGFKEAYQEYIEGGWQALNVPKENGGMGIPLSVGLVKNELLATGNWAWFMYPGLTMGAMNTLILHGSAEQKDIYLTKMAEGTWTGTMCLTEPHCGTDLAHIRTKAVPNDDGSYSLTGTKIFISAGEHDMAENIVHIALAKLPDAPQGTKGISLFVVPKYLPKEDGTLSDKKNVECGAIEKKMGIHGCATAQIHFEGSKGWLIGKPHDGLRQMFTFMNTARLGTSMQGIVHMELAYQNAVAYALERGSMRALSGAKEKDKPQDPIIHHGDVRRMLLTSKALLEGSRALMYDCARLGDIITEAEQKGKPVPHEAEVEMGLLTPIAKGCVTEWSFEASNLCLQVFGGHGYIKDHGMEQIVRDCRIATLYEGTTGIQALDMIGRKMMMDKLRGFSHLNKKIVGYGRSQLLSGPFRRLGMKLVQACLQWRIDVAKLAVAASSNRDVISCASVDHLFNAGYIVLGYYWLRMGTAAYNKLQSETNPDKKRFYQSKVDTMNFYFSYLFDRRLGHAANMINSHKTIMKPTKDDFLFLEPMSA